MARTVIQSIENNFVNGLVTEATGLNFPENAVVETLNTVYDNKGVVERRKGLDLEADFITLTAVSTGNAITTYQWDGASGNGIHLFIVTQIGSTLFFYKVDGPTLSTKILVDQVSIDVYKVPGSPPTNTETCQFASGLNCLLVVHPYCEPFYVEYDPDTNTVDSTGISISTRDLKGLGDAYIDRGGLLLPEHKYNLFNQGWSQFFIDQFISATGTVPGDYDVWWLYKNNEEQFDPVKYASTVTRGSSPAPRGYFLLTEFYQDRGSKIGDASIPVVTSGYNRPSACAFYAGRAFYAGTSHKTFSSKIYFSQILEDPNQFGRCYQINDTTSEHSSDLLPTDGGVIVIPEVGVIYRLEAVESGLVVFASNGIWAITGSAAIGFSANDFTVKFISNVKVISKDSFVHLNGVPSWWSSEGIYSLKINSTAGSIEVISITEERVKTFYQSIPEASKRYARGAYDPLTRTATWVYSSTTPTTVHGRYEYDRLLVLNLLTSAFWYHEVNTNNVKIKNISLAGGRGYASSLEDVTVAGGGIVTDLAENDVQAPAYVETIFPFIFKYLVQYTIEGVQMFTWANMDYPFHRDWYKFNTAGVPFRSFFTTGYKIRGDALKNSQPNYVNVFADSSKTDAVMIQGIWDYNINDAVTGFTNPQWLYYVNDNVTYEKRRVKIRGSGITYQLRFESVDDQPFRIIGWSAFETVNQLP